MTLNDVTVNFAHLKAKSILSDWTWLIGKSKLPIMLCSSGDAFVQDKKTFEVYFLDVWGGNLDKVANSGDEFSTKMKDSDFANEYLSVQWVGNLLHSGLQLEKGQIFSLKKPSVLGGEFKPNNAEVTDIEVHYSINGQIHGQLKDVPVGTPINNIKIMPQKTKRKWYQFGN
jgi:hypothetical protein